jgi:glycosyltransferase involved in cell wall biosynthesis
LDASWSAVLDRLDPIGRRYVRAVRALDLRNTAGATTLLANSRFTAGNVRRIYGRQAPVSDFGVDSARFRPPGDGVRERFVLSVGALRPEKGFDFVIEALALVPAATRPALRIVANADDALERAYLTELAARCGVDLRIEISVSEERLVERYRRAELVVYAPIREPFGLAALEAMACGVPVVGVDEGGVRETVIDGITGRLVERDEAQFADAVAILTADDVLRRRLGEQARRHVVERWSWEAAVASVEEHLVATAGRT